MIAIVTDSNAQLPSQLAERYGVEIVPLTVTVDGVAYLEGVDLDADDFYARFQAAHSEVSTAQPSPGQFARTYATAAERGATEILSVHIGSSLSGTVNSARLAASTAEVPVHIVDTGTASFAVSCCVWEAAEAVASGASLDQAVAAAERARDTVGNVFVVRALGVARAGGRLAAGATEVPEEGIPVLTLEGGAMRPVGTARTTEEAARVMAGHVRAAGAGAPLRVGVGLADAGTAPIVEALEELLVGTPEVRELVRYRIGPSVGAHTGPGTVGTMYYPVA